MANFFRKNLDRGVFQKEWSMEKCLLAYVRPELRNLDTSAPFRTFMTLPFLARYIDHSDKDQKQPLRSFKKVLWVEALFELETPSKDQRTLEWRNRNDETIKRLDVNCYWV